MTAGQPRTNGSAHAILAKVKKAGHGVALTIQGELASVFGGNGRSGAVTEKDTTTVPEAPDDKRPAYGDATTPAEGARDERAEASTEETSVSESTEPVAPAADVNPVDTSTTNDSAYDNNRVADAPAEFKTDPQKTGLVAPKLMDPVRLPAWVDPVNKAPMSAIELEISTTGTVKRVRMLSAATHMTDMMMLSAAKTWLFEPASMNGQPVTYVMTLGVTPNR